MPSPTECVADISGSSPTTPLPELLVVAEKLKGKLPNTEIVREEEIIPEIVILDDIIPQSVIEVKIVQSPRVSPRTQTTKFNSNGEYVTEDSFSVSSYGSYPDPEASNECIQTIAQEMENVSEYKFEVFEPQAPGRAVSSTFIVMYSLLGLTILTMIILTVVFNFGMLLLLVMIVIIFIIIVILTNFCVMMYQI